MGEVLFGLTFILAIYLLPTIVVYHILKSRFERRLAEEKEQMYSEMRRFRLPSPEQGDQEQSPGLASETPSASRVRRPGETRRASVFQNDPTIPMGPRVWELPDVPAIPPTTPREKPGEAEFSCQPDVPVTTLADAAVATSLGVPDESGAKRDAQAERDEREEQIFVEMVTEAIAESSAPETSVFQDEQREESEAEEPGAFSFELAIGRKVLGWLAVFLFVTGGAFFVKLAIDRGWLGPMNRFIGLALVGCALLALGRRCFRKGWRRYSSMVNSAGVVTLFCTAWYAKAASLFPATVSLTLLLAVVVGGFLLAACYRSRIIGFVALLGGFALPLLVRSGQIPSFFAYLFFLNFSTLLLVNLLKRSPLALIAMVGSLFMVAFSHNQYALDVVYLYAVLAFLLAGWLIYYFDALLVVARRGRALGKEDTIRLIAAPVLFFFGARYFLMMAGDEIYLFEPFIFMQKAGDFLATWDGPTALTLTVLYGLAAFWSAGRVHAEIEEDEAGGPECGVSLVSGRHRLHASLRDQASAFLCMALGFLALCIPLLFTGSLIATCWLSLAVLLLLTGYRYVSLSFLCWSCLFFVLGGIRLLAVDFVPNLLPIPAFINGSTIPWFHAQSFAVFYSGLLLLIAFFALRILRPATRTGPDEIRSGNFFSDVRITKTELGRGYRTLGKLYSVTGGLFLFVLSVSEIFSCLSAWFYRGGILSPGLLSWTVLVAFVLLASLVGYCVGLLRRLKALRMTAFFLLLLASVVCFISLASHPVLPMNIALPGASLLETFRQPGTPIATIDLHVPWYTIPLSSYYSILLLVSSVTLVALGVVMRNSQYLRAGEPVLDASGEVDCAEYASGLAAGVFGTIFLLFWSSFDCWHYFNFTSGSESLFLPLHCTWLLWTTAGALLVILGICFRSLALRTLFYLLTLLQGVTVFVFEFFLPVRNPLGDSWPLLNLDSMPVVAFSALLIVASIYLKRNVNLLSNSEHGRRQERVTAVVWGTCGLAIFWLLLSFETYRYFSGKDWFGPPEWTRLLALGLLWSAIIFVFMYLAKRYGSGLMRGLLFCLVAILLGKGLFYELIFRPAFSTPLCNFYLMDIVLISCVALIACAVLDRLVTRKIQERQTESRPQGANPWSLTLQMANLKTERFLYRGLSACGLLFLWLGMSIDVYQGVSIFPAAEGLDKIFLAQMALSVLWSLFAGVLLALGFWRNDSVLRWSAILLFGLTTIKVLTVDLSNIDQIYRVIAFFTLALVLAAAAAGYQRYRPKHPEKENDLNEPAGRPESSERETKTAQPGR
ncbi:MAG: DUF2339 domain-containing protein [Planctomycetia bacterium]|nr:DUF2339 domain-containing protein [Planctomycetia bacterium]